MIFQWITERDDSGNPDDKLQTVVNRLDNLRGFFCGGLLLYVHDMHELKRWNKKFGQCFLLAKAAEMFR